MVEYYILCRYFDDQNNVVEDYDINRLLNTNSIHSIIKYNKGIINLQKYIKNNEDKIRNSINSIKLLLFLIELKYEPLSEYHELYIKFRDLYREYCIINSNIKIYFADNDKIMHDNIYKYNDSLCYNNYDTDNTDLEYIKCFALFVSRSLLSNLLSMMD